MKTLAVVILTRNEEDNIEAVIENAKQCGGEVLIVDSGSDDRTIELAEKSGAKVTRRAWDGDFSAQRNFALGETAADWVIYLDADERFTADTVADIKKILNEEDFSAQYRVKRKTVSFGAIFNHGALHPDYVQRMFPRDMVKWVNPVHEHPECPLPTKTLAGYLEHYAYKDLNEWIDKLKFYTDIWAKAAYDRGKRANTAAPFLHAFLGTLRMFFVKAGFLDGWAGIYMCINHFFYTMMKYLKLREIEREKARG